MDLAVVGVDVGGRQKGFHAVALRGRKFLDKTTNLNPTAVADWCYDKGAMVVAVDAPCHWSSYGSSRLAERQLGERGIHCFFSPTRRAALSHSFYEWMLNGERLFNSLESHGYPLFEGERFEGPMCIETFPHAVVWAMAKRLVPSKHKAASRREALTSGGYDISALSNIDYVDAALCAVTANAFCKSQYTRFGDRQEGFIITPNVLLGGI